jgi:hypothetical protein
MARALALVVLGFAGVAFGATVTVDKPTQGQTNSGATVAISVSLSQDFQTGRDGWVQIWVDGSLATTLSATSGSVRLSPGDHQIQARLVDLDHHPLRVPANSERITVTVPAVDAEGN